MPTYEVESTVPCTVDGVGLLTPGNKVLVTEEMHNLFYTLHKVSLMEANFPKHVTVTKLGNT